MPDQVPKCVLDAIHPDHPAYASLVAGELRVVEDRIPPRVRKLVTDSLPGGTKAWGEFRAGDFTVYYRSPSA